MATRLYPRYTELNAPGPHSGAQANDLRGNSTGWQTLPMATTLSGSASQTATATCAAGPTAGIEVLIQAAGPIQWISEPLDADVAISGNITFNIWAAESAMTTNVAINCVIERLGPDMSVISQIIKTTRTAEVNLTTPAVNNWVEAAAGTTNMLKGDRLRFRIFGDDAGTMGAGTLTVWFRGPTAAATGDTYIEFGQTFGFLTSAPGGSVLYLTDSAGPAVGANIEKEMWTARGGGVTSIVVNTAAGWTAPIQWTNTGGGTAVEWYSKQLAAFTLSGRAELNHRGLESALTGNAGVRAQLAVCNNDGSGAVVWSECCWANVATETSGELSTSERAITLVLAGNDVAVTDGQRLRLRCYIDDQSLVAMAASQTATMYYAGASGGASGDTFLTLPQSVSEFAVAYQPRNSVTNHQEPGLLMKGWVRDKLGGLWRRPDIWLPDGALRA